MFLQGRFQEAYRPVMMRQDGACWPGFARTDWIETAELDGLEVLEWSNTAMQQ